MVYTEIKSGIAYAEEQMSLESSPILLEIIRQCSVYKKVKILDFGCGFGGHSLSCSKINNCEVYGIDIDPNHIMIANKLKKKYKAKNVTFELRDILSDPLPPEDQFNIIMFNDVIEHIPVEALTKILEESRKHLTANGKIYFGYPPWEGPYAAHVYRAIKIPWIQYLPNKITLKLIKNNNQEIIGYIESDLIQAYNGLNRITHEKILRILRKVNLTPILRKSHCILNRLKPFKDINFGFFPFKHLITYEILVLSK